MAYTQVADVIVPEIFLPYVIERTAEKSELVQSGIISTDPQFTTLVNQGGNTVAMPFWADLTGNDQVLSDSGSLTTKKISAKQDFAVHHLRGDAWSTNDLAKLLSGDDPMGAIGDLVGAYWARKTQATTISTLKGVFAIASMAASLHAIHATTGSLSTANYLHGSTFADGVQKLGDAKEKLTAVIMHSAVENSLVKQDLIDFIPDSEGKLTIKVFMGKRVIVDDGCPTQTVNSATVYTTYLFGQGALAMGVSTNDEPVEGGNGSWQLEFERDGLAGNSVMINRRRFILHPRGVKWLGASVAGLAPTNAECESSSNWLRVYEQKNVRMVVITHNIAL